jgi:curli biogenesis system outer membrane secretion channel CsgG
VNGYELSSYIINSLTVNLVNNSNLTVIERSDINTILKEQKYQLSGDVDDNTAVSIGHQIGAQKIIYGSIIKTMRYMQK